MSSILVMLLISAGMLWFSSQKLSHEAQEVFDTALVQTTLVVQSLLPDDLEEEEYEEAESILFEIQEQYSEQILGQKERQNDRNRFYKNDIVIVIQSESGLALVASHPKSTELSHNKEGFSEQVIDGASWKSFSVFDKKRKLWISSSHLKETRTEIIREVAESVLPVLSIGTLLLCLALYYIVRKGLSPLQKISRDLQSRQSNNLSPMVLQEFPKELETTLASLNSMFEKVDIAVQREQGFTDDAAHQLRTPLASMLVHLDALPEGEVRAALNHNIDNMSRLVNQLLQLARLSPKSQQSIVLESVNLNDLCAVVIAQMHPKALQKQMTIELISRNQSEVLASTTLLEALIVNLLDNAIHYSKPGDNLQIIVDISEDYGSVNVIDHGPGISSDEQKKVWERFYRVSHSQEKGSGLGLSIVKEIVTLFNGQYALKETQFGGLTVKILIPLAQ